MNGGARKDSGKAILNGVFKWFYSLFLRCVDFWLDDLVCDVNILKIHFRIFNNPTSRIKTVATFKLNYLHITSAKSIHAGSAFVLETIHENTQHKSFANWIDSGRTWLGLKDLIKHTKRRKLLAVNWFTNRIVPPIRERAPDYCLFRLHPFWCSQICCLFKDARYGLANKPNFRKSLQSNLIHDFRKILAGTFSGTPPPRWEYGEGKTLTCFSNK